jgi:hypothetical protein
MMTGKPTSVLGKSTLALIPFVVVLGILLASHSAIAASPTQLIMSCTIPAPGSNSPNGCSSTEGVTTPNIVVGDTIYIIGGFWVWCQVSGQDAYGLQCAGSMYIFEANTITHAGSYEATSISGQATASSPPTVSFTTSDNDMTCVLKVISQSTLSGTCDGYPITFSNVIITTT